MKTAILTATLATMALACTEDPDTAVADATAQATDAFDPAPDAGQGIDAFDPAPETHPVPAEWVGNWTLVEVWATPTDGALAGQSIAGHGENRCVRLGWDQALNHLGIEADGHFAGWILTDTTDEWRGMLVDAVNPGAPEGARAMRVDDCDYFCYEHDTQIGKLGHAAVVDGHLEITRQATLVFDADGTDCSVCPTTGETPSSAESRSAHLVLRYAPDEPRVSSESRCFP